MAATAAITIAGRTYEIACDDGQEKTLKTLAVEIDERARHLLKAVGQVSDARLLVMVALTLVDDLTEARRNGTPPALPMPPPEPAFDEQSDLRLAALIDKFADRIEAIAERVDKA